MKKKLALLGLIGILALASCNKKEDTTKRSDNPSTSNKEILHLEDVKQGNLIKEIKSDEADYVTIKVAENYKDTLFYLTTDLTATFEEHKSLTKKISFNTLSFTSNITDSEKTALADYMYNEAGIKSKDLGFDISSDLGNWVTNVDVTTIVNDYLETSDSYSISIVYIPTLVSHYQTSFTSLECYVMFPLYYQIYKNEQKEQIFDTKATDLSTKLEFDGDYLKSETVEVSA